MLKTLSSLPETEDRFLGTSAVKAKPFETRDTLAKAVANGTAVPMILRVAGLPASAVTDFRSERCLDVLAAIEATRTDLTEIRDRAREALYAALPKVPAALRGFVLGLKRDCFNNRPIADRNRERIAVLRPWIDDVLDRVIEIETQLAEQTSHYEAVYRDERDRVLQLLLDLAARQETQRALALASRHLARNVPKLARKPWHAFGRKERGLEASLVRYLTRAAVKLSPYSTFTKVGLCVAVPGEHLEPSNTAGEHGIGLLPGPWASTSLVRLKSYIPNQWMALIERISEVRRQLDVSLNGSLELLPSGDCRYLRPLTLIWNRDKAKWHFVKAAKVSGQLRGALHDWITQSLGTERVPFTTLVQRAARDLEVDNASAEEAISHYVDLGVLNLARPWATYSAWPEKELSRFLASPALAKIATLDPVRAAVDDLVAAEASYGTCGEPDAVLGRIETLAQAVFDTARDAAGIGDALQLESARQDVYEDVLERCVEAPHGVLATIDRATAEELLAAGDAFWQVRGLFSSRHEVRLTLWHEARERWPEPTRVACLEFFDTFEDTAKRYATHLVEKKNHTFNPLSLEEIHKLERLRETVSRSLRNAVERRDDGEYLSIESVRRIAALIPSQYRPLCGSCLPVQPTGAASNEWVTHHMTDGIGRMSSRFNSLFQGSALHWFTEHWRARSHHSTSAGEGELLDLLFTQLTTVGRHWPQTDAVLEALGETVGTDVRRILKPCDLEIEIGEEPGDLRLLDHRGCRYFPTVLSVINRAWLPTFYKFLVILGHDPTSRFELGESTTIAEGIEQLERLTIGRLVIRRKRWSLGPEVLPAFDHDAARAFEQVRSWRTEIGLPERVFWQEVIQRSSGRSDIKPQWIDFGSPVLVSILVDGMRKAPPDALMVFEECLPEPEGFSSDASPSKTEGDTRAAEIVLESLAFSELSAG
ncbi:MAG: lantibiotic dehydratase [Acidobacteriota bacterium]